MIMLACRAVARVSGLARRSLSALTMLFVAALVMIGLALPGTAAAQSLTGAQVSYAQNYPSIGSLFLQQGPVTVGSSIEFPVAQGGLLSIDVTSGQIIVTGTGNGEFISPVSHNGPVLTFNMTITSASVDASSDLGYNAVTTTSNAVRIDLQGVTVTPGKRLVINVNITRPNVGLTDGIIFLIVAGCQRQHRHNRYSSTP